MLSLSKTFKYEGNVTDSFFKTAGFQLTVPQFTYAGNSIAGAPVISRQEIGSISVKIEQKLEQLSYRIELPLYALSGSDITTRLNFIAYTMQRLNDMNSSLDDLGFDITSNYQFGDLSPIPGKTFNILYFIKMPVVTTLPVPSARVDAVSMPDDPESYLKENVFIINRDVYTAINATFQSLSKSTSAIRLLHFIKKYVELSNINPNDIKSVDQLPVDKFTETARQLDISNPQAVIALVKEHFIDLFDFPVSVPEIKLVKAAGSLHIKTSDPSIKLSKSDLFFYHLSMEYKAVVPDESSVPVALNIDWTINNKPFDNNKTSFSFTDKKPLLQSAVDGPVTITVKSFEGAVIWSKDFSPSDPELAHLSIEVDFIRPAVLTGADGKKGNDGNKKIRGQVLDLSKKVNLKDLTVMIRAQKPNDDTWHIVGAANTDSSGNFSIPYPFGVYAAAQAVISLSPDSTVDIPVNADNGNKQTISDDFLYLLIKDATIDTGDTEEDDCDCHAKKKAARLPDQKDLIDSDEYTQDIGGSCINLTTPNRTLNEYNYHAIVRTSDPDVANYTLRKMQDGSFELVGDNKKIKRGQVDLSNPIRWQDAPDYNTNLSLYQSVTVATGHILHYKSEFKADGYSLGDLLYSLALAPGQKKEVVVLDSSHTLQASESQTISQGERLAAGLIDDREITNQLGGSINEAMRGQSSATTSGISAGLGVGASMGFIGAALGVSGGYANSNSSASQNSSRNVSQFFGEKLRQSIMQNADSYRQLNASVVTTVKEGQTYTATTDVVANHNHCHALTMMYFEVLKHYAIYQELTDVEECVFVPLLMTNFTTENIYKWADVLAKHLLPMHSNTYLQPFNFLTGGRQHPLLKAFDANERIKTNYARVDFPSGSYDDEKINFIKGEINLRVNLQRPKTKYDRIKSLPVTSKTVTHEEYDKSTEVKSVAAAVLTGGLSLLFDGGSNTKTVSEQVLIRAAIFDSFMQLDANYQKVPPAQCIRIVNFQPTTFTIPGIGDIPISGADFFENGNIDKQLWSTYATILGYANVYDMLDYYFKGRLISEWDDIFNQDILPIVFEKIVDSIKIDFLALDLTAAAKYKGGERVMQIRLNGSANKKRNEFPLSILLYSNSAVIKSLKGMVTLNTENVRILYSTSHYNGTLFNGYLGDDLLDGSTLPIPENADEKKDPRKEDQYLVSKLIEHLNSNLEHYNKVLWYNLDADRRYMLLDGFSIQVFNDFGEPTGYRSLASVVKNQLISVVGNSLVFPVAAGYKVSQSFITEKSSEGDEQEISLLDHYKPLTPVPPYRISIPSKGVFLEAVKGSCDACEKVQNNTSQDWDKFKTDEPTQIEPITTPVPTITDWKAAFKDLASPVVNIQNAPALPDPGSGLSGITELLGKAGIFKDITGLDANQQNVLKTYLSNQENAKAFAEMAKEMSMQSHNTQNSDKIMDSLKAAKDNGALSQEDYSKLVKDHLQQQIDGGTGKQADTANAKAQKPSLTDAAVKAVDLGKDVKAQKTDSEGNTESVEISGGKPDTILAAVTGTVPPMKQENDMACWATAATMMMSWKAGKALTVPEVLSNAGDAYLKKFQNKEGLKSSEKPAFIAALNMEGEPPVNYPVDKYLELLKTYGPLWITTDAASATGKFSPHARILTKIVAAGGESDKVNFVFIDPATGIEKTETFQEFISAFEQMVTDNASDNLYVQIVHFKDAAGTPSEGGTGTTTFTYNRQAALAYARKYWNKPASDGYVATKNGHFKAPAGSKFIPVLSADKLRILNDKLVDATDTVQLDVNMAEDCTHFMSCIIGTPPNDTAGGLPNIYGITDFVPYFVQVFLIGRKIGTIVGERFSKDPDLVNQLSPGDIIVYNQNGSPGHMAMLGNNGKIICHTYMRTDEDIQDKTWDCSWDLGASDPAWTWTFVKMP